METKICTKCGEEKPANKIYFTLDKRIKSGICSICKECKNKAERDYLLLNPDKVRERKMKWANNNRQKIQEKTKRELKENPDRVRNRKAKWEKKNRDKVNDLRRKQRDRLNDWYVVFTLKTQFNIPTSEITPLDIKEKREQLQYHRQIKSLTKQLKQNENKS